MSKESRPGRAATDAEGVYPHICDAVREDLDPALFSTRHNALYGADEFAECVIRAVASNGTLASATSRLRELHAEADLRYPTPEWVRSILAAVEPGTGESMLGAAAARQLGKMSAAGLLRRLLIVAVDIHDGPRWDARPGLELVRSRERDGTCTFERVMTAQCAGRGTRITLAFSPMGALDDIPGTLERIIETVQRACAAAGVEPVFVMDRGFPSAATLRVLREAGARYLMMLRRTDNVVAAMREHDAGERPATSTAEMVSRGWVERYTIVMEGRRGGAPPGAPPEGRYVAFAVSDAGVDVAWYAMRWMIETWYRELEDARVRTASHNPAGRVLCMAFSLLMLNAWAMLMEFRPAPLMAVRVTHAAFCYAAGDLAERGLRPKPPPKPPP